MYQIEIKNADKYLKIILSASVLAHLKTRFPVAEEFTHFIKQLAISMMQFRTSDNKNTVLIDSLFLPLFLNNQTVHAHYLYTSERNYLDSEIKEDITTLPDCLASEISLNKAINANEYIIDMIDGSDNTEFDTNIFKNKFPATHAEWLKCIAPCLPQSLPPCKNTQPHNRSEPVLHELQNSAERLCQNLHHPELTSHLCEQDSINNVIAKTWDSIKKRVPLQNWIDSNIVTHAADASIQHYHTTQQQRAKRAVVDAMKQKTETTKAELEKIFRDDYLNHLDAISRTHYLKLDCQSYIIKMNIVIALYNAAREYFYSIWESTLHDPNKMAEKIHEFNRQFAGIARINFSSMQLTPLSEACNHLGSISLSQFEEKIDNTINQCKISSAHAILRNHQEAFAFVKEHLNALQSAQDIYAPGEGSRLGFLIRPFKKLPGVATIFDAIDTIKTFTFGESQKFTFNAEVKQLEQQITAKLAETKPALLNLDRFLLTVTQEAKKRLTPSEHDYAEYFEHANYNIAAYCDLQQKANALTTGLAQKDTHLLNTLESINKASAELHDLLFNLSDLKIDILNRDAIQNEANHEMIRNNLAAHTEQIKLIQTRIAKMTDTLQAITQNSHNTETLWLEPFKYKHTEQIQLLESEFNDIHTAIKQLDIHIAATLRQLSVTEDLSQACLSYKAIFEAINEFEVKFNQMKEQAINENNLADFMETGRFTLATVNRHYQSLVEKTTQQHLLLDTYNTHHIESKTSQLLVQFKSETNSKLNELHQSVTHFNKNYAKVILCHIVANAILNFPHWQAAKNRLEARCTMQLGNNSYYLPKSIGKLAKLLKEKRFDDWKVNPSQAELLLNALKQAATQERLFANDSYKSFQQALQNLNIHHVNNMDSLIEKRQSLNLFAGSSKHPVSESFISTFKLGTLLYTKNFRKRQPILANILIGAITTFALLALTALILTLTALTGGAAALALTAAAASFVAIVGSPSVAIGLIATLGLIATAIGGLVGGLVGKATVKHQQYKERVKAAENAAISTEPTGETFGSTRKFVTNFGALAMSPTLTTSNNPFDPIVHNVQLDSNANQFEEDDHSLSNPFARI